jgi:ferrous-iron efflux pump FieF
MANVDPHKKRLLKLASSLSVITAASLLALKFFAYWWTDSVSILASLLDSALDIIASIINLIAIRYALQPPDKEHPFGHGKAEALAGLGQATFISGSAFFLIIQALNSLSDPAELMALDVGMYVMLFSMIATAALVLFQRYVYRQTQSIAIKADSLHYLTDLLSNSMVILALGLVYYGLNWMDPLMAILIGFYILHSAWQIVRESVNMLLDRELDEDIQQAVIELVLADEEVVALHEMKTRQSGHVQFIQLHIEMDGKKTLAEAHDVSERLMKELQFLYPSAEIIIHQDPHNDSVDENLRITATE